MYIGDIMTQPPFSTLSKNYLMWFRRDLRLSDNTALTQLFDAALQPVATGELTALESNVSTVHAVYSITCKQWLEQDMSLVQMDFIFRTLKQFAKALSHMLNLKLHIIMSDTFDGSVTDITQLCQSLNITHVFANTEYEVNEQTRDERLAQRLAALNIKFKRYHDQCILPPNSVKTNADTLYKVFTPFYNKWQSIIAASPVMLYDLPSVNHGLNNDNDSPLPATPGMPSMPSMPTTLTTSLATLEKYHQRTLSQFQQHYGYTTAAMQDLLTHARQDYPAGEVAAITRVESFINEDIADYNTARDKPALMATSQLSAYLTVGAISARLCYQRANALLTQDASQKVDVDIDTNFDIDPHVGLNKGSPEFGQSQTDIERWISELAWRDFYRHVIDNRPDIVKGKAYNRVTDRRVNWSYDNEDLTAWCTGMTGVPLVDAAMRCLNQTGFMHNRLRMVTAMFLTKDLLIDWRLGERYFMQRLIDGDFASNNGGWQWSASTGVDASPYFRIMNPFSQAKSHDTEAMFIKKWVPELSAIPASILHDERKLGKALSDVGRFAHVNYPTPMVNHKQARAYAIQQFKGEAS